MQDKILFHNLSDFDKVFNVYAQEDFVKQTVKVPSPEMRDEQLENKSTALTYSLNTKSQN